MRFGWRAVLALILMAPLAAAGDNTPRVTLATPGSDASGIRRFTLRFSQPMVPLGDPRAAAPAAITCPVDGGGRWIDQSTYVYDFAAPVPGGATCTFELEQGLRSTAGYAVEGQRRFTVEGGGPTARAVLPGAYGSEVEEDQVFLVATSMPADPRSVAANAYCAVDGIGEKIAVDVLSADMPARLLKAMGTDEYRAYGFLDSAGLPTELADDPAELKRALASVTALRCRRPLPPGRDMALVWGAGVRGQGGGALAGREQRYDYRVRQPFTARFDCAKVNAQSGCSPVEDAHVRFTAEVPRDTAAAVRIRLPDGTLLAPTISDEQKRLATLTDLTFKPPLPVSTKAEVVLPAGIKDESGRALANAERFPLATRFDEPPPLIKFAATFGILEAAEGGVLPVTVRNVEPALAGRNLAVAGRSVRLPADDRAIADWLRRLTDADESKFDEVERGGETIRINQTGAKSLLGTSGAPIKIGLPAGGKAFEVVGVPLKQPGFYVVEFASPTLGRALLGRDAPRYVAAGALVTDLAVHFKWGTERSLAWVTRLSDGKVVAGAEVRVTDSCTGQQLAAGRTDAQGRVGIAAGLPKPESYGSCDESSTNHPLMVSARLSGDMSFTLTGWGDGIRPWDFDLPYGYEPQGEIVHTVFDRALLRQGETIHMKHIVRQPVAAGFVRPAAFDGTLKLVHRGSGTEYPLPFAIAANGSGETAWTAPAGAAMGDYDLRIEAGDRTIYTSQSFRVDEYRLPTMRASVTGPKEAAVRPKTLPLDLFAGYLSGGGAANLPVELRVAYRPSSRRPDNYDRFTFGGRAVAEGTQPLNGDGEEDAAPLPPTQTIPLTLDGNGAARTGIEVPAMDADADMLVEMDYEDANGEVLTATKRVPLYTAAVQLGLATDGWLMKADDLRLRFVTLDTGGKPVAGQKVSVELFSREVLTARRRLIGGFYAYENQRRTTKIDADCTATTDKLGLAQCSIDPGVSGEVTVVATTTDASGNVSRAVTSVWLAGDDEWWFGGDNGDRMDVVPEQQEYKAGETARFQVRMPFRAATALVTVEREGVLSSFVTQLSGSDPVVEVPMPGAYAPDVYVSVLAVRGRVGGWRLWLADLARSWGLSWFSQDGARPTATVDLAKPAYRIGIAKVKVGWEGHRLPVAVQAARDRYAPREAADVLVRVAAPGGKPAPSADVAFVAVDEALLQLAPNESWDVLKAMMGERPLSVLTATAQMQVVGKRHYGRKAVEAGGGGGDASALNRENFQPVLLWRGRLPLDAQGHARVRVPLSDALTSFKLVAIATDGDGLFGTGETSIRTQQDLSIFAGLPPLVRSGDWYGARFTLRNGSDKPMTVTATAALTPRVAQGKPITVTIPAGGAVPVAWNLTAPQGAGPLRWQVTARTADGRASDAVSVAQEVKPAVPEEVWAATLTRVGEGAPIPIAAPAGALPGRGGVSILLSDTVAPELTGVRAYMASYPYTCFEQRLSKAVALGDAGAWNRLAGEMPSYQDGDGLLRYFPSDNLPGSEALTAYVLSITTAAGLNLPEGPRARMVEALRGVLDGRLRHEDYGDQRLTKLAAFTALAGAGAATPEMLGQIGLAPEDMPTASLADYMMALDKLTAPDAAARRGAAEQVLRQRFVYEGTRLDLADQSNQPWWLMSSADEAAIKAWLAVLGRPGWQDDAGRIAVGVAQRQQRGHWSTTPANAWGSVATRRFAAAYPSTAIAGLTTASLSGAQQTRSWPLALPQRTLSFPLPSRPAPLLLRQSGTGGPWATVQVRAAVPLRQPLAAGYRLGRAVEVIQRHKPDRLTRGDVLRVTLTVEAAADRSWVVISDPLPAGATVLGRLGGQSELLDEGAGTAASYTEGGNEAWRAYFAWFPQGTTKVSYTVRLNGAGRLQLPPSRVEAMYAPGIFAAVPNSPLVIAER